ncbi:MAG: alpha/beta hydrolase [bacterium]|nr:alpha/beta hydrolase [bacterium]
MHTFTIHGPNGPVGGVDGGRGKAVFLIAGLGASTRLWGEFPRILARSFRVLALDNRGIGTSREGEPFSLDRAAEDILAVAQEFDLDSFALLGASLGGTIALNTALSSPQSVRRLVVISCAPHLSEHGRKTLGLLDLLLQRLSPSEFGDALMHLAFAPPFAARHSEFVAETSVLYGLAPEDVPGTQTQLNHLLKGWDLRDGLTQLKVPSLVMVGGRDAIVAPEETRALANLLPKSDLFEDGNVGHSLLAEVGATALEYVRDFLG